MPFDYERGDASKLKNTFFVREELFGKLTTFPDRKEVLISWLFLSWGVTRNEDHDAGVVKEAREKILKNINSNQYVKSMP